MDITVENIIKTYGPQRAVDEISFHVKTGEILGFLGPNGAGKTTTMKIITNFMWPDQGQVVMGGKPMNDYADELKKHIGYLPENNPLYEDMPVLDYLQFVSDLHQLPKEKIPGRIREMVKVCGLNAEKHKKIGELSKGYRQRVGLAQALIHDPEILILDEPTSGLDPNQIMEIRKLIRDLGQHKTVILSTHILPEVEATCDRILIINKGKIVADGTAATLRKQAQGREVIKVKIEEGEVNEIFSALQQLPGSSVVDFLDRQQQFFEIQAKPDQNLARQVFKLCVDRNWVITQLTPVETRLEDVFRELTMN